MTTKIVTLTKRQLENQARIDSWLAANPNGTVRAACEATGESKSLYYFVRFKLGVTGKRGPKRNSSGMVSGDVNGGVRRRF